MAAYHNPLVPRMDMSSSSSSSSSSQAACKISMLWNWYTIDSCFIARSWQVKTRGQFAGSCIGCFFLVMSAQWLHRVAREYDAAIARRRLFQLSKNTDLALDESSLEKNGSTEENNNGLDMHRSQEFVNGDSFLSSLFQPIIYTLSHQWFWDFKDGSNANAVYPTFTEHILRSLIFTLQWGLSYIIMLLFMYYNGYIIISCILGALFGRVFFNYEPITCTTRKDSESNDKKCCM